MEIADETSMHCRTGKRTRRNQNSDSMSNSYFETRATNASGKSKIGKQEWYVRAVERKCFVRQVPKLTDKFQRVTSIK